MFVSISILHICVFTYLCIVIVIENFRFLQHLPWEAYCKGPAYLQALHCIRDQQRSESGCYGDLEEEAEQLLPWFSLRMRKLRRRSIRWIRWKRRNFILSPYKWKSCVVLSSSALDWWRGWMAVLVENLNSGEVSYFHWAVSHSDIFLYWAVILLTFIT